MHRAHRPCAHAGPHPTIEATAVLDTRIVIRPAGLDPDTEPLLVGFLSDMPFGQQLGRSQARGSPPASNGSR